MPAPSLYLDECVDAKIANELRHRGYTVTTAVGEGIVGVDDDVQIAHAYHHRLMILSHNRGHFYTAHQRGVQHAGIILMPRVVEQTLTLRTAMMLDWIAQEGHYYYGRLYRWHDLGTLLERGVRLPSYTEAEVREVLGRRPQGASQKSRTLPRLETLIPRRDSATQAPARNSYYDAETGRHRRSD